MSSSTTHCLLSSACNLGRFCWTLVLISTCPLSGTTVGVEGLGAIGVLGKGFDVIVGGILPPPVAPPTCEGCGAGFTNDEAPHREEKSKRLNAIFLLS